MRSIQGAVAVVTGAGSGIGRALAVQLGALGAELALADVNAAALDETCKLVGSVKARTYTVDVAQAATVESFALAIQRDFGRASLLINNAGVALFGTFAELTLAEME
jgi:NAD(P)-dependent dehydrogenase (short-subunit alcohol dehydrogenase family)